MSFSPTFRFKLRVYKSLNETISEGVRKLRLIGKLIKLLAVSSIGTKLVTPCRFSIKFLKIVILNKQNETSVIKETEYSQKRPYYFFFLK